MSNNCHNEKYYVSANVIEKYYNRKFVSVTPTLVATFRLFSFSPYKIQPSSSKINLWLVFHHKGRSCSCRRYSCRVGARRYWGSSVDIPPAPLLNPPLTKQVIFNPPPPSTHHLHQRTSSLVYYVQLVYKLFFPTNVFWNRTSISSFGEFAVHGIMC